MATFISTIDALNTLCISIPVWKKRLEELNGQIAQRQIELARLTEDRPPTARSVKNKGSTESLRPKDGEDNPFGHVSTEDIHINPFESPQSMQNGFPTAPRPSSAAVRAAAATPPSPPKATPNSKASPSALTQQSSPPTKPRVTPAVLRKRKTESLASGESLVPKYRTRSMIIVYYDSTVQTAFEELVKFVSVSRSAMRKGKMAAKMSEMQRAAEIEVEGDDDDNEGQFGDLFPDGVVRGEPTLPATRVASKNELEADDAEIPKLSFVSTRQMGPPRGYPTPAENISNTLNLGMSLGMMKGYRRNNGAPDIFDILDKGLEWCQGQCEHAAHQFLREGECTTEIDNIKKKLSEIKEAAEKGIEGIKQEEATLPKKIPVRGSVRMPEQIKIRGLRDVHVRRDFAPPKDRLEVDESAFMEVDDDEGVDDLEPPALIFKRSRDLGR